MTAISEWKLERCMKRIARCRNISRKARLWLGSTKSLADTDAVTEHKELAMKYLDEASRYLDLAVSFVASLDAKHGQDNVEK